MRPSSVLPLAVLIGGPLLLCAAAHADATGARHGRAVLTDVVQYHCASGPTGAQPQDVRVRVELTMPTGVVTDRQVTIGWHGIYVGEPLRAPATGLPPGTALWAYASISKLPPVTSGTGSESLGAEISAGEAVPLPAVAIKTTLRTAGRAEVRPGAINVGPEDSDRVIKCEVTNKDDLTAYPLTVTSDTGTGRPTPTATPTPTPTPTPTATPIPTPTPTSTFTDTETENEDESAATEAPGADRSGKVTRIPAGAADTGGGGLAGLDGRVLVGVGLLVVLAAGAGLRSRRDSNNG
ncbi:hypothetical protein ABZT47_27815 [Sphaerisporangium sp. NPDC005289]|uniref:hypothetical protein n=1 Tax=Sphaerisporangium sp. NPDC005289 TaxID=3155247 RepID=UPI0033BA446F